jgi:hypothetical protein
MIGSGYIADLDTLLVILDIFLDSLIRSKLLTGCCLVSLLLILWKYAVYDTPIDPIELGEQPKKNCVASLIWDIFDHMENKRPEKKIK